MRISAVVSSSIILILVGTLHFTLSKYESCLHKVSILNEAKDNPLARVVTSEQAVNIVNTLNKSGASVADLDMVKTKLTSSNVSKTQGGLNSN